MNKRLSILKEIFVGLEQQASLEAAAVAAEALDGKAGIEREKVFYCKIANFTQLEKAASWEDQEQWEIRPTETGTGVVRVRKTSAGELSLATKVFSGDSKVETEIEIPEDIFEGFRAVAPGGMIKRRYVFPIPDTKFKWEIDVYRVRGDEWSEWCKVDLECDDLNMDNPAFPIEFSEVISGDRSKITQEQREILDDLFKNVFITPNPKLKTVSAEQRK
jgi:hypothetical protein